MMPSGRARSRRGRSSRPWRGRRRRSPSLIRSTSTVTTWARPATPRPRPSRCGRSRGRAAGKNVIGDVNGHPEVGGDVGPVVFGPATTVTADGPVEHLLYASSGRKWVNVDIELETGCGIVPSSYRAEGAGAALQWGVGLELFLLAKD